MNRWIEFDERLPTTKVSEQEDILFGNENWATFFKGMYTHDPFSPIEDRLSYWDSVNDKFITWGRKDNLPTHWMKVSELGEQPPISEEDYESNFEKFMLDVGVRWEDFDKPMDMSMIIHLFATNRESDALARGRRDGISSVMDIVNKISKK